MVSLDKGATLVARPDVLFAPISVPVCAVTRKFTRVGWPRAMLLSATVLCLLLARSPDVPSAKAMTAIALAAAISSIGGFAFSAICGAVLFHLDMQPVQAVEIMMMCSVANQTSMVWAMRYNIDWRCLAVFIIGGAFGLPIGLWLLLHADRSAYIHVLGVLLAMYGAYMLLRRPFVLQRQHRIFDVVAGMLGGITGGAIAYPSASVTMWCATKGWDKDRQRALFQPFILVMQVAALLILHLLHGSPLRAGIEVSGLLCVPGSLLGTSIGLLCFSTLSDRRFSQAINLLLIISGASYLA